MLYVFYKYNCLNRNGINFFSFQVESQVRRDRWNKMVFSVLTRFEGCVVSLGYQINLKYLNSLLP